MCGVEEPLLPERRAVEDRAAQSEGAFETQEARHLRLHKTAGLRGLDVWAEISKGKKAGRDLKRIGALTLRELTRRAQPRSFYTSPKSVELLNLAALHHASTLPSVKEPLLRGSRREARVGVLHHPADLLELSAGMQPGPFEVQRPHQAVASRVNRGPVRVERTLEGVGGYALPGGALVVWVEGRNALLVDIPGPPCPAIVAALISDRVEVPADYQLTVHEPHHLHRA